MRATVQRDSRVTNDYGDSGAPNWETHLSALACHAWNKPGGQTSGITYGDEAVTSDYYPVMIVPLGTDITETDRVYEIQDLRGNQLFGTMTITVVLRRPGHLEVRMKDHA